MTKMELLLRLSRTGDKTFKLLDKSTFDYNKLMKLKKTELEQFLEAYETISNMISKCLVEKVDTSPCAKCNVYDKPSCCGCMEYFEWKGKK